MSAESLVITEENIERVRNLLNCMQSGDEEQAGKSIDELVRFRESSLYIELGKLTRDLHDSINGFQLDTRVNTIANEEIPDAKERLNHVIEMTAKAADTTLEMIEDSLPICTDIERKAKKLSEELKNFTKREMSVEDFRGFLKSLNAFLDDSVVENEKLKNKLNEVLMAQGFQDLTGQIIKRVIILVNEVEDKLVGIIKVAGTAMTVEEPVEKDKIKAEGPHIASIDKGDFVSGQDEVDDLLSSLGF
ncbi:Chemotaxis response - phosphatase CheZ [hydrothermal vent metagenome]|uniref:Protein phosphatase CheZ n=1 Tax=hydrothermal vent metagenome TaxID=652676 RepID=A0A3B0ZZT0_9ZZZZ